MQRKPHNGALAASLLLVMILFGANNTGVKFMVRYWPPVFIGATRFFLAGVIMMALLRWTKTLGPVSPITPALNRQLWWRSGLNMAVYTVAFNAALKLTSVSHVAVYLGAAPVWALLWEGKPEKGWKTAQVYGAAALAFSGVLILSWPVLRSSSTRMPGEILGMASSVLWTSFGRQCRRIGQQLPGPEITAHTFWRTGVLLAPFALVEVLSVNTIPWRADVVWIQLFCIFVGGVGAYVLWNNALRHWKTSQVYLFNNIVPIATMAFSHFCLDEPFTRTFWMAMALIGSGVLIGQADLQKLFGVFWLPAD